MTQRFTEEFKIQTVKQVTEHGYSVTSFSERLGVTSSSLYNWIKASAQRVKNIGNLKNSPAELSGKKKNLNA